MAAARHSSNTTAEAMQYITLPFGQQYTLDHMVEQLAPKVKGKFSQSKLTGLLHALSHFYCAHITYALRLSLPAQRNGLGHSTSSAHKIIVNRDVAALVCRPCCWEGSGTLCSVL
jgi:hypothetical protein